MSDLPTLKSLLERVEAATRPDRELDGAIWRETVGFDPERMLPRSWPDIGSPASPFPPLTASLDASLALVEEMLPDEWPQFEVHARMIWDVHEWWHFWEITVPSREFQGRSKLAPLALLQCAIRALIQKETADHA